MKKPQDYEILDTLDISGINLPELPSWIMDCHNLKELNCSWNQITQLDNLPQSLTILNC